MYIYRYNTFEVGLHACVCVCLSMYLLACMCVHREGCMYVCVHVIACVHVYVCVLVCVHLVLFLLIGITSLLAQPCSDHAVPNIDSAHCYYGNHLIHTLAFLRKAY